MRALMRPIPGEKKYASANDLGSLAVAVQQNLRIASSSAADETPRTEVTEGPFYSAATPSETSTTETEPAPVAGSEGEHEQEPLPLYTYELGGFSPTEDLFAQLLASASAFASTCSTPQEDDASTVVPDGLDVPPLFPDAGRARVAANAAAATGLDFDFDIEEGVSMATLDFMHLDFDASSGFETEAAPASVPWCTGGGVGGVQATDGYGPAEGQGFADAPYV